ncbi:MAG: SDR family oxidoreductase [Pseudomonadales bacterium]|nr:SDR family oxidoreductase [Pseudomonadales bacterium]
MHRFDGIRCIVTGAADGIGRATAERLIAEGAVIVVCDRNGAPLDSIGARAALTLDVTDPGAPAALMQAAAEHMGGLDVLVNNAGISAGAPIEALSDELWHRVIGINLDAVFRICRAAIPSLKASGRGRIVNVGSVMSTHAAAGMGAYTVSKHGIAGLTRTLALELGPFGITANYVQPGAIVTGITRDVFAADAAFRDFWTNKAAVRRLGQPADIAAAIAFLASADAAFITGHGLLVDGGALQSP